MRTKGKLHVVNKGAASGIFIDLPGNKDFWFGQLYGELAEENAPHLVACWNAIESIGGDPETVGELVKALNPLASAAITFEGSRGSAAEMFLWSRQSNIPGSKEPSISVQDALNAQAVIDKTEGKL